MEDIHLQQYPKQSSQQVQQLPNDEDFDDQPKYGRNYDAAHDKRDMYRLGKKQELKRRFKYCACTAACQVSRQPMLTTCSLNCRLRCRSGQYLGVWGGHIYLWSRQRWHGRSYLDDYCGVSGHVSMRVEYG